MRKWWRGLCIMLLTISFPVILNLQGKITEKQGRGDSSRVNNVSFGCENYGV